jgi:dephospho-CoA kinase
MLRVGITGGIGSGKSLVSNLFSLYNIPVFNADSAAKFLMNYDAKTKNALVATFGEAIYKEGRIDRPSLANIIFNNEDKLLALNQIVHPNVADYYNTWHLSQCAPYTLKEAAIMFESGSASMMDYIIGVTAPVPVRMERVMKRDGISSAKVKERMDNQMDEGEKMKLCNFVIHNDDCQSVIQQVHIIHHQLIQLVK